MDDDGNNSRVFLTAIENPLLWAIIDTEHMGTRSIWIDLSDPRYNQRLYPQKYIERNAHKKSSDIFQAIWKAS